MKKVLFKLIIFMLALPSFTAWAQYQKITNNNLNIYFREFGGGEPLLIIGGGPGDVSDRYLSICNLLDENYRCILVDQRGTGKSAPENPDTANINIDLTLRDFEAIRIKLGLRSWNILGFSYGGYLASLYAHFYPSSIKSLILMDSMGLNTGAFAYFRDNITSRMSTDDIELMNYWIDSSRVAQNPSLAITERIRAMMPGYFYDREKSFEVSQTIKPEDFNFKMGNLIWKDVISRNLDLAEMGVNYTGRVLILYGRQDPIGAPVAEKLNIYYPDSKLIYIEKCGHYSWIEQPEIVLSKIKSFLTD